MYKDDNKQKSKEKPCWLYIESEPINSFKEIQTKMTSKNIEDKKEALRTIIGSITNDENYPDNLMMQVMHNLSIIDDVSLKKLLFLFWEVIEKKYPDGRVREEFLLVCNTLRNDLTHANEYVRGRTLRLISKLPYNEILENLKSPIFDNLTHKHLYVRKNALVCLSSIISNFGVDVLPNNIVERLREMIERDGDTSVRRNAYIALAKIDHEVSFQVTKDILQANDLNELSDLFTITIVENLKNLSRQDPKKKSKILKMLSDLSSHKSHSVLFEIGTTLLQLSSNPNIVRNAVNILCNLLVEQKDNNTLIIILRKLIEIKQKYKDILEEQVLSFAIILNSNCTNELRKLLFELISDLIKASNISSVFDIFINDFNKLKNVNDTDFSIEFKNMILLCMYKNIEKHPKLNKTYPMYLLEKCLLYNSRNTFINEQITIIKDLFKIYGNAYNTEFLNIVVKTFEDINSPEILQASIWLLAEYANDIDSLRRVFDLIMKNIGDLNLELVEKKNEKVVTMEKKVITKTVILPDGTYGTQTIEVDPYEYMKQKENTKYLRTFILETNFFFSTNLIEALTRILICIFYKDESEHKGVFNKYYVNTIEIICAILKIKSDKIYIDPDNASRVNICLSSLINNDIEQLYEWMKESKEIYNKYYHKDEEKLTTVSKAAANVDDFISFRHVRQFDPDNLDVGDEDGEIAIGKNSHDYNLKSNNKFIEVLTGCEVLITLTIGSYSY
jgi:coatomer subunit beta